MKAAVFYKNGPPEVLRIEEVANPPLKAGEVRVKVAAAAINPMDYKTRQATVLIRIIAALFGAVGPRIGADFAGVVDALGPGAAGLKAGDEVFGVARGACAEYVNALETKMCLKPKGVSFADAAALPVAGLTALQGLRDHGAIKKGGRVLVYGASGGIGHYAVQIARHFGAEVDAVCSTPNLGWVKALGAREVIDYTREDFTRRGVKYDLIYDTVGYTTYFSCRKCLAENGVYVTANFINRARNIPQLLVGAVLRRRKAKSFVAKVNPADLAILAGLVAQGGLKPRIDRRFPLEQIVEAHRYAEAGHTKGKVVIEIQG